MNYILHLTNQTHLKTIRTREFQKIAKKNREREYPEAIIETAGRAQILGQPM